MRRESSKRLLISIPGFNEARARFEGDGTPVLLARWQPFFRTEYQVEGLDDFATGTLDANGYAKVTGLNAALLVLIGPRPIHSISRSI